MGTALEQPVTLQGLVEARGLQDLKVDLIEPFRSFRAKFRLFMCENRIGFNEFSRLFPTLYSRSETLCLKVFKALRLDQEEQRLTYQDFVRSVDFLHSCSQDERAQALLVIAGVGLKQDYGLEDVAEVSSTFQHLLTQPLQVQAHSLSSLKNELLKKVNYEQLLVKDLNMTEEECKLEQQMVKRLAQQSEPGQQKVQYPISAEWTNKWKKYVCEKYSLGGLRFLEAKTQQETMERKGSPRVEGAARRAEVTAKRKGSPQREGGKRKKGQGRESRLVEEETPLQEEVLERGQDEVFNFMDLLGEGIHPGPINNKCISSEFQGVLKDVVLYKDYYVLSKPDWRLLKHIYGCDLQLERRVRPGAALCEVGVLSLRIFGFTKGVLTPLGRHQFSPQQSLANLEEYILILMRGYTSALYLDVWYKNLGGGFKQADTPGSLEELGFQKICFVIALHHNEYFEFQKQLAIWNQQPFIGDIFGFFFERTSIPATILSIEPDGSALLHFMGRPYSQQRYYCYQDITTASRQKIKITARNLGTRSCIPSLGKSNYASAVLQCLFNFRELRDYLVQSQLFQDQNNRESFPIHSCLSGVAKKVFKRLKVSVHALTQILKAEVRLDAQPQSFGFVQSMLSGLSREAQTYSRSYNFIDDCFATGVLRTVSCPKCMKEESKSSSVFVLEVTPEIVKEMCFSVTFLDSGWQQSSFSVSLPREKATLEVLAAQLKKKLKWGDNFEVGALKNRTIVVVERSRYRRSLAELKLTEGDTIFVVDPPVVSDSLPTYEKETMVGQLVDFQTADGEVGFGRIGRFEPDCCVLDVAYAGEKRRLKLPLGRIYPLLTVCSGRVDFSCVMQGRVGHLDSGSLTLFPSVLVALRVPYYVSYRGLGECLQTLVRSQQLLSEEAPFTPETYSVLLVKKGTSECLFCGVNLSSPISFKRCKCQLGSDEIISLKYDLRKLNFTVLLKYSSYLSSLFLRRVVPATQPEQALNKILDSSLNLTSHCSCGSAKARTRVRISRIPNVLILGVNRQLLHKGEPVTLSCPVSFPQLLDVSGLVTEELSNSTRTKFQLIAGCLQDKQREQWQHYAIVREQKFWLSCHEEGVGELAKAELESPVPFLLFYENRQFTNTLSVHRN